MIAVVPGSLRDLTDTPSSYLGQGGRFLRANAGETAVEFALIEANAIADGAVATAKLANAAVTSAKLASNAVDSGKIAASAVTADKIAAAAVTTAKLADSAVTSVKVAPGAVGADQLQEAFRSTCRISS
jgi:hypothetical protein